MQYGPVRLLVTMNQKALQLYFVGFVVFVLINVK